MESDERLEKLVTQVRSGKVYSPISEDLIRWIGNKEIAKRRNLKAAIKATRSKLHQVGNAYLSEKINYEHWLQELHMIDSLSGRDLRKFCLQMMERHISTRERLSFIDEFYTRTLGSLGQVRSILDIGCGLNPLAVPWMPLVQDFEYYGLDIYEDMAGFLNRFLAHLQIKGNVCTHNLVQGEGKGYPRTHVALLLKTIPCLEQLDKTIGPRLLENINAEHLLVSFPTRSLSGSSKGMHQYYESHFWNLVSGKDWEIQRFNFPNELAFLITPG